MLASGLTYVGDNAIPRDHIYFGVMPAAPEARRVKMGGYEGEQSACYLSKNLTHCIQDALRFLHVLHAPQTKEPPTVSNVLYRLISSHRPGLTWQEFANVIGHCEKCGLVATRRKLSVHEEQCGDRYVMTKLTADDVRCLDDGKFLTLLYQLDNGGPGLTPAVFTQMFSRCCCGMVVATRKFNLHECKAREEPPSYQ